MEKFECPECNGEMFENLVDGSQGLTCKKCNKRIEDADANQVRMLLCMISTLKIEVLTQGRIIELGKRMRELEKQQIEYILKRD